MHYQHNIDRDQGYKIFAQILNGVQQLHTRAIIHRDIKPANILIGKGEDGGRVYKLSDFGMAKELDRGEIIKSYVGTKNYMSI